MSEKKSTKPGNWIIIQERCNSVYSLMVVVEELAKQGKQISIYKDGPEWVVSYNEGPSQD